MVCDESLADVICSRATPSSGSSWVVLSSVSLMRSVRVVFLDQLPFQKPTSGTTIVPLPPVVPEEELPLQPAAGALGRRFPEQRPRGHARHRPRARQEGPLAALLVQQLRGAARGAQVRACLGAAHHGLDAVRGVRVRVDVDPGPAVQRAPLGDRRRRRLRQRGAPGRLRHPPACRRPRGRPLCPAPEGQAVPPPARRRLSAGCAAVEAPGARDSGEYGRWRVGGTIGYR